jgi:hypothetical protein
VSATNGKRLAGHDPNDERTARDDAADFLRAMLADGPRLAKEVQAEARAAGITKRTLERAKKLLGVISSKAGLAAGWQWSLPSDPECGQGGQHAHTQKGGRLGGQGATFADSESQPQPPAATGATTEGNDGGGPPQPSQDGDAGPEGAADKPKTAGFDPDAGHFEPYTVDPVGGPCVLCGQFTRGRLARTGELRHKLGCPG